MSGTPVTAWLGRELSGGRYRVDAQLGEGGMGTVFRAWDKNLSTEVVIKVPHAAMLQDAEFAARFAREISSLVKLSHPHIVKISDVGDDEGLPFAVMQFLPGGSLEDRQKSDSSHLIQARCASEGFTSVGSSADSLARASGLSGADQSSTPIRALPPESLKSWLVSIAEALDFVHSQGYIHRDVKPANILFDAHGHAYLSDFGIAKSAEAGAAVSSRTLTGAGMVIGTPEYMAPELIMGQTCDGRVDQYALAVTVFEMLAGRRPFEEATSTALYVQHATAEPPDLATLIADVSPAIAAAIHRALSKSPDQRFASCRVFATVLLGAVETFTASQPEAADSKCPVCQSSLKLADRMRGKQLRCAGCHSMLHVSDDLRLVPVPRSANETVARATTRLASGTRGQGIISAVEADNGSRLQSSHVSHNKGSEPIPVKSSASATQRAASLGEPTSRSMSGKTIRPSMLPSSKTKSPATQHERQTAAEPLMLLVGKFLRQFKGDFQAFARRHPTLIATVVWVLVLASIPPVMLYVFKEKERDDNSVPAKLESDSSATTREPQPADVNHPPIPSPASVQPSIAEPQTPETIPSEKPTDDLDRLISKSTGMEFVLIPAGEFLMGSSDADVTAAVNALGKQKIDRKNLADQQPQHRVLIAKAFYMSAHETTQAQYEQIIGTNQSEFSASGKYSKQVSGQNTSRFPVENVSWFDAVEFCNKLGEQESRTPCYRLTSIERSDGSIKSASVAILRGDGYRLPTEAEWEYACRAKSTTPFHFGSWLNGEEANVNGNYPFGTTTKGPFKDRTTVVGSYSANAFGLYDMHGNAWEWCQDGYDENYYAQRVERDPQGAPRNDLRVLRGGSWDYDCRGARSAHHGAITPGHRGYNVGFRVVCVSATKQPETAPIASKPEPRAGEEREDNGLRMKFCWCPPGTFTMGSPVTEVDRDRNEDQVLVTLTRGFWMGKFEVTQGEWLQTMRTSLTQQKVKSKTNTFGLITGRGARHPMYFVSYDEATEFCVKLSEQERRAGRLPNDWRYRLPTEAQWEYACRAGTTTATAFGESLSSTLVNFNGNIPTGSASKGPNLNRTTEVGSYEPNDWSLCDMHGNVIEWCADIYVEKHPGGRDPLVFQVIGGANRVNRGGSWNAIGGLSRSAWRGAGPPDSRHASAGFRVALVPEG